MKKKSCNNIIFNFLCFIHTLVWVFIIGAFLDPKAAEFNLYIMIPMIYILHILPFHILQLFKKMSCYNLSDSEVYEEYMGKSRLIGGFAELQDYAGKTTTYSPISTQGMMLWGAISCAYVLRKT